MIKKMLSVIGVSAMLGFNAYAGDVNVYYFWQSPRCMTCKKIEAYTKQSVEKMNDKSVHFVSADLSKAEYKPAIQKYGLYTKSVVLTKTVDGKEQWKNLTQIWDYIGSESGFENYITKEIQQFK